MKVFARTFEYLDKFVPLSTGSWSSVSSISVEHGLNGDRADDLVFTLKGDETMRVFLNDCKHFKGSSLSNSKSRKNECEYYLVHNDLHIVLVINHATPSGKQSAFGLSDVILEACCTTILDMEDSVACVDGPDKAHIYQNWTATNRQCIGTHWHMRC